MAQIQINDDTGLFDVVTDDGDLIMSVTNEGVDYIGVPDQASYPEVSPQDLLESMVSDPVADPQTSGSYSEIDDYPILYSVTPSSMSYSPTAWQINIASNRPFASHYLMWGERVYVGNTNYWRYHLVTGFNVSKSGDIYNFNDGKHYVYQSYNNQITYDVYNDSGAVNGSSYLVYSDLFFDYVGSKTADRLTPYMVYFMGLIILICLLRGRNHV